MLTCTNMFFCKTKISKILQLNFFATQCHFLSEMFLSEMFFDWHVPILVFEKNKILCFKKIKKLSTVGQTIFLWVATKKPQKNPTMLRLLLWTTSVLGLNISEYCCGVRYVLGVGYLCSQCCPNAGTPTFFTVNQTTVCKCANGPQFLAQVCPESPTTQPTTGSAAPTRMFYPTFSPATTTYPTQLSPTRTQPTHRPSYAWTAKPTTSQPTTHTSPPTVTTSITDPSVASQPAADLIGLKISIAIAMALLLCLCAYCAYRKHQSLHTQDEFIMLEQHPL